MFEGQRGVFVLKLKHPFACRHFPYRERFIIGLCRSI